MNKIKIKKDSIIEEKFLNLILKLIDYLQLKFNYKQLFRFRKLILSFKTRIIFIVEIDNWAVYWIQKNIKDNLKRIGLNVEIASPHLVKKRIIQWGSINYFLQNKNISNSNKLKKNIHIVNLYHLLKNDIRLNSILLLNKKLDLIVTPSPFTKKILIESGFNEEKIALIPLGVDLSHFKAYDEETRKTLKLKYNLPLDKIIIGSFQKDGKGWGDGMEPKLVKGPDIFCEIVRKLKAKFDIHIFLAGPARGYVKSKLEESQIPYTNLDIYHLDIVKCYNVLDLYIIASRIEGGPLALPEGMATGVPIVTTNVGMAPYYINNGENGFITEIEDVEELYINSVKILEDKELRERIILNAFETVKQFSWENIAKQYYDKVYKRFLKN